MSNAFDPFSSRGPNIFFALPPMPCVWPKLRRGAAWMLPTELLKELRQWELNAERISYSAAISACAKGAAWLQPHELQREAGLRDLEEDVIEYSAAISACEKGEAGLMPGERQWERWLWE